MIAEGFMVLQKAFLVRCTVAVLIGGAGIAAHAAAPVVPFKLGTFDVKGQEKVGLVLRDAVVVDIAVANQEYERRNGRAAKVRAPADMKDLITRYDAEVGPRLRELARFATDAGTAEFIHPMNQVKTLPPVRPAVILNAGSNYPEHAAGIIAQGARGAAAAGAPNAGGAAGAGGPPGAGGAPGAGGPPAGARQASQSMPGYWERPAGETRPENPYLFLKSPTTVVGAFDDIIIPKGRVQVDWECEFTVVIGNEAKNVSVANAPMHIFGYTAQIDVSDRGGRGDRKMGGSVDWLVQKNHDTFGPIGPFIVPKEFMPNPMNVRHYFTLNGEIKQDSNTSRSEYGIHDMVSFGSNNLTLRPGDLIAMGSPAGANIDTGAQRWMKAGDTAVCTIEGIGEQKHRVVDQK
jgi:2-keto-4-pentenoate hydratase/2-oxohepta-3-ene-1,7-dioic acid hydratase in catechol pathway